VRGEHRSPGRGSSMSGIPVRLPARWRRSRSPPENITVPPPAPRR